MSKEEILKYAEILFKSYQSIPKDAFINSITGESSLNVKQSIDGEYATNLHTPFGMIKPRKETDVAVSFIPVFYYETETVGLYVQYYNLKANKTLKVGPFKTASDLTDALYEYNSLSAMTYILGALKTDAGFANTYQDMQKLYNEKIQNFVELPLMKVIEKDSLLGPVLTVATRYINNPYAYNDVKMEVIRIDGYSGVVSVHYNEPIIINSRNIGDMLWEKFSKKNSKETLAEAILKIKESRKREDEIIKRIRSIK